MVQRQHIDGMEADPLRMQQRWHQRGVAYLEDMVGEALRLQLWTESEVGEGYLSGYSIPGHTRATGSRYYNHWMIDVAEGLASPLQDQRVTLGGRSEGVSPTDRAIVAASDKLFWQGHVEAGILKPDSHFVTTYQGLGRVCSLSLVIGPEEVLPVW